MKLGLVTAIFDSLDYRQTMQAMGELGLEAAEVACWPAGKAERRYAGVSHIDVDRVLADDDYSQSVLSCADENGIQITNLAYYPNNLDADLERRGAANDHLKNVIAAAQKLGVNSVGTFIGRMQDRTVEENLAEVKRVWPELVAYAEDRGVKITIENCPMLFSSDEWPGGQNLMTTPALWDEIFSILDSDMFGLNFDPSHFVWQQMDYVKAVYDYRDKIFHVHFKDIKLLPEGLNRYGTMAYPLKFMSPKIPGLGDIDWDRFVSALTDIGYDGGACIEVEDRSFEGSDELVKKSVAQAARYMRNFV